MRIPQLTAILFSVFIPVASIAQEIQKPAAPFRPPQDISAVKGPMGEAIRLGEKVLTQTQRYAKQ